MELFLNLTFILILQNFCIFITEADNIVKEHNEYTIDAMLPLEFHPTRTVLIFRGKKFYEYNLEERILKNEQESEEVFTGNITFPVDAATFSRRNTTDYGLVFAVNFIKGKTIKILVFNSSEAFIESKSLVENLHLIVHTIIGNALIKNTEAFFHGAATDFSRGIEKKAYFLACLDGKHVTKGQVIGIEPAELDKTEHWGDKVIEGCGAMEVVSDGEDGHQLLMVKGDQLHLYDMENEKVNWEKVITTIDIPTEVFGKTSLKTITIVLAVLVVGMCLLTGGVIVMAFVIKSRRRVDYFQEKSTQDTELGTKRASLTNIKSLKTFQ